MQIDNFIAPEKALEELGRRIAERRRELGLTQLELADQCGVAKRTIERIEGGQDPQLSTFIKVLQMLRLADRLESLLPQAVMSPMEALMGASAPRRRVRARRPAGAPWKWEDER